MSKKTIVKVILKTLYFRKVTNNVMNKKWLLNTLQVEEQVTPKLETGSFPASPFLETPHTCIQYRAWNLN